MRETPSWLFEEWRAYWRCEPWGEEWKQTATIGSICSTAGTNYKYDKPLTISELMPKYRLTSDREETDADHNEQAMRNVEPAMKTGGS